LYANGLGLPIDHVEGFVWFSKAKAAGLKQAAKALTQIRSIMTPRQLNTAMAILSTGGTPAETSKPEVTGRDGSMTCPADSSSFASTQQH